MPVVIMNRRRCQKFLITGNLRNLSESRNFPAKNPKRVAIVHAVASLHFTRIDEGVMLIIMILRYLRIL